ncbi:MAG: hypothetical protein ACP5I8_12450 [Phycisphaerae bacterium]
MTHSCEGGKSNTQRPETPHPGPRLSHADAGKMPAVQWGTPSIRRIGGRAEYIHPATPGFI